MQGKFGLRRPAAGTVLGAFALFVAAASGGYAMAQTSQPEIVVACQSDKSLVLANAKTGECPPNKVRVELTTTSYEGFARTDEHAALKQRVAALETKLSTVRYDATGLNGVPTVSIVGANLQIINGTGATDSPATCAQPRACNGLGNLFIGYNEPDAAGETQTGSHNLIIGQGHTFTSYGGLVAGSSNAVHGPSSSVSGQTNTASGNASSVSGGHLNTASVTASSVSGGFDNTASGHSSSVSGGVGNMAGGFGSSVSGGHKNTAGEDRSSVSGGGFNTASGSMSSVSGGSSNQASGDMSSVSGGEDNNAVFDWSSILGGKSKLVAGPHATSP